MGSPAQKWRKKVRRRIPFTTVSPSKRLDHFSKASALVTKGLICAHGRGFKVRHQRADSTHYYWSGTALLDRTPGFKLFITSDAKT